MGQLKLFTGSTGEELASEIATQLDADLNKVDIKKFSDGEFNLKAKPSQSLEGCTAVIIQSTPPPVNDNLMELLLEIEAIKGLGVESLIAIVPYFGYSRQARRHQQGEPISAKVVIQTIESAGVDRIISVDIHDEKIKSFAGVPLKNVDPATRIAKYIKREFSLSKSMMIVSPDNGGAKKAKKVANWLSLDWIVLEKTRTGQGRIEMTALEEEDPSWTFERAILVDDMVTTGGTMIKATNLLEKHGIERVDGICTHGILCGNALTKLDNSSLTNLSVSNTVKLGRVPDWVNSFSVSSSLANELRRNISK